METTDERRPLAKINAAAKGIGVSAKLLRQLISEGRLTAYALTPKVMLVDPAELRTVVEACRVQPATATA